MADEISLDLEELRHLQRIAKRPRVLFLITSEINNLEKLSKENAPSTVPQPAPVPLDSHRVSTPTLIYTPVSTYSWDQDNLKLKIYFPLEGVQEEKVEKKFESMSLVLKFHDVQGKNYIFGIPKLFQEIAPENSKLIVKPTRVTIVLAKKSKGNWTDLHYRENTLKPKMDENLESKDPMAGIMDLMKNMYEEGDEEMKKTIAKAWTEARSGKVADSFKGNR